jgi:hypothetical protein
MLPSKCRTLDRFCRTVVVAAAMIAGMVVLSPAASASSPIELLLPQGPAFSILGHSCGGIQEKVYATGFDPASGYPTGDVYLQTRCGGSGRGGGYHTTTYSAWVAVTWDLTGAVISYQALAGAPTVNTNLTAFDAFGNEVYNQNNLAYLLLADGFVLAPRVTGVSVTFGPASGGTSLTISGTGFTGATAVTFGTTAAASFTVNGDTSITTTSPAASGGTVDITVTTAGGTSATNANDQFSFVTAPVVSNLSPTSGTVAGGTWVTITGANFTRATGVMFGDAAAGFTIDSDTSITAYSPPGETPDTVDVTVTSPGGTSATGAADVFTYTSADVPQNPFMAYFTNVLERCRFRPASTNCTVRGRLIIQNTGTSTLPAMTVLLFSGADGGFGPLTHQLVKIFLTKPIQPGQGGLPAKPEKLKLKATAPQELTGVFLYATDANSNLLTSTVIP